MGLNWWIVFATGSSCFFAGFSPKSRPRSGLARSIDSYHVPGEITRSHNRVMDPFGQGEEIWVVGACDDARMSSAVPVQAEEVFSVECKYRSTLRNRELENSRIAGLLIRLARFRDR